MSKYNLIRGEAFVSGERVSTFGKCLACGMTVKIVVVGIIIAVAAHTCHVVHRTRNGCLDTGICSGSIEGDASPSAYYF